MIKIFLALALGAMPQMYVAQIQMPVETPQGQTKTPPPKQVAKPTANSKSLTNGKRTAAAAGATSEEDRKIEAAIRAKLAKSKIGKDGLTVRVQGGVAIWEGSTSVVQHKGSATRMAKAAGAHAVVNNIKITDAAKQKAAENLDEGRRRAQVKRSDPRVQQ